MDKGILNEVIAAEKDVQQCIEQEQMRLQEWLEQVKRETENAVSQEEQNDGAVREQELAAAKRDAEKRAQQITGEAAALAGRLEQLDDGTLTGIILKRLPGILLE
jgi:vacuolar-type H+-ATPase subunit H